MGLILCTALVDGLLCGHASRELSGPSIRAVMSAGGEARCSCHGGGLTFPCSVSWEAPCRCPMTCEVHPRPTVVGYTKPTTCTQPGCWKWASAGHLFCYLHRGREATP